MDENKRSHKEIAIASDLVVVGGGMAGVCSAISAARSGIKVCLIQDRPVLGGCASSEVRVWILGATSHLGNNNRWSREGGIIDEILIENLYRNKAGNAVIFDTILLDKVTAEPNITLLLNTAVYGVEKSNATTISSVQAFCSQNSTQYLVSGKMFCDASGDGVVGFLSGAPFVIGAESQDEFDEALAPVEEQTELLGHTLFFYSKDVGKPSKFVPPEFAKNTKISDERLKRIDKGEDGIRLWWIEYGGTSDTIHETEMIKWELWSVVYTIWDHIKNSGKFDDVDNLTLEWVGTIPGKRESRRFIGHHMLTQKNVVEQHSFDDAISYGGWAIDHHPSEGVFSEDSPCQQYHAKGVYQIPLACFISKGMSNLFLAGRIISASHIAFGSTRVMATSAHGGQAVGEAAAMCIKENLQPEQLLEFNRIKALQTTLNKRGHFIPGVAINHAASLLKSANINASSALSLSSFAFNGDYQPLAISAAQLLPLKADTLYNFDVQLKVKQATTLTVQLRISDKKENYTPNVTLQEHNFELAAGEQVLHIPFTQSLASDQYAFVCFLQNHDVEIGYSDERVSGIVSVFNGKNKAVSNNGKQVVDGDIGIDEFEFWIPARRPNGQNISMTIAPAITDFSCSSIANGYTRPWLRSNAWVASKEEASSQLELTWSTEQSISELVLHFDNDFDHPLESTLMGHPEDVMPFCVRSYRIKTDNGDVIYRKDDNHQTVNVITFDKKIGTKRLIIEVDKPSEHCPSAIFEVLVS